MQASACALGCKLFKNFTRGCPGIEQSLDPESYALIVSGVCEDQCMWSDYAPGQWWYYTNFTQYFTCLDAHRKSCDFWEVKMYCVPMLEEVVWGCQLLSSVCCVMVLKRLYRDIRKGWLQQALFLSIAHNLAQVCITEECFNVFAKHIVPKNVPKAIVVIIMKYVHVWCMLGGLIWAIAAGIALLKITHGTKYCVACTRYTRRHKVFFIVLVEIGIFGMLILSIIARLLVWRSFFQAFTIAGIIMLSVGVISFALPACKAKQMQMVAKRQQKQRASYASTQSQDRSLMNGHTSALPPRVIKIVQVRPFLLLLAVLICTYLPFIIIYSLPVYLTRATQITAWVCMDLVGVWNFLAMLVIAANNYFQRRKNLSNIAMTPFKKKNQIVFFRGWLKNNYIVATTKNSGDFYGCHTFTRTLHSSSSFFHERNNIDHSNSNRRSEKIFSICSECSLYGRGCVMVMHESGGRGEGKEAEGEQLSGDFEQSEEGGLLRWSKRASWSPRNSVQAVGLPLEKFYLFVDSKLQSFFPLNILQPLTIGFLFTVNLSSEEDAEQRLHLKAINEFEVASLNWYSLYEDNVQSPEEFSNQLEQAQVSWAYNETVFRLKAAIEVLLRWTQQMKDLAIPFEVSTEPSVVETTNIPEPKHQAVGLQISLSVPNEEPNANDFQIVDTTVGMTSHYEFDSADNLGSMHESEMS